MTKWIKNWYNKMKMNEVERYLSQSKDIADLERRQQALSRGEVRFF